MPEWYMFRTNLTRFLHLQRNPQCNVYLLSAAPLSCVANTLGMLNMDGPNAVAIASVGGIVGTPVLGCLRIASEGPKYTWVVRRSCLSLPFPLFLMLDPKNVFLAAG